MAVKIISLMNSKDIIGNRFHDLPVNSEMSELSAPPPPREKYLQHVNAECEQSAEFINASTGL